LKNRQYSLKVFETTVKNETKFIAFFETNYLLFKDHLILIQGEMNETIRQYLEKKHLTFLHNTSLPVGRSRKALEEEIQLHSNEINAKDNEILQEKNRALLYKNFALQKEIEALAAEKGAHEQKSKSEVDKVQDEITKLSEKLKNNFTVLDSIIRSGRELNIEGDLLLLNRVNSGATIHTTGNLIATQIVEGELRCNGNFMMITVSPKAHIIFHGLSVDNSLLKDKLNRIELKNNEIIITPVIKKEINWV